MNADGLLNLAGSLVTLALVVSVLMRGTQFAQIIRAIGATFSGALRTAMGR